MKLKAGQMYMMHEQQKNPHFLFYKIYLVIIEQSWWSFNNDWMSTTY